MLDRIQNSDDQPFEFNMLTMIEVAFIYKNGPFKLIHYFFFIMAMSD